MIGVDADVPLTYKIRVATVNIMEVDDFEHDRGVRTDWTLPETTTGCFEPCAETSGKARPVVL